MPIASKVDSTISIGGVVVGNSRTLEEGQAIQIDEDIADQTTDGLLALSVDVSQLRAVVITSDQDITLETNDGSAPDDTIDLLADVPYFWTSDYLELSFSDDITALYVTNDSGSTASLKATFIIDPTI